MQLDSTSHFFLRCSLCLIGTFLAQLDSTSHFFLRRSLCLIGTFLARSWQGRRVICTDTYVVFSRAEQNMLIDSIPLSEIKSVEQLNETLNDTNRQANEDDSAKTQSQSVLTRKKSMVAHPMDVESYKQENNPSASFESEPRASNIRVARIHALGRNSDVVTRMPHSSVIQIKTDRDGHNSGRTYYIRTKTPENDGQLITTLLSLAESAKIRAENKSRFERNQLQVRRVYISRPFQTLMAVLILGVGMNYAKQFDLAFVLVLSPCRFLIRISSPMQRRRS